MSMIDPVDPIASKKKAKQPDWIGGGTNAAILFRSSSVFAPVEGVAKADVDSIGKYLNGQQ